MEIPIIYDEHAREMANFREMLQCIAEAAQKILGQRTKVVWMEPTNNGAYLTVVRYVPVYLWRIPVWSFTKPLFFISVSGQAHLYTSSDELIKFVHQAMQEHADKYPREDRRWELNVHLPA